MKTIETAEIYELGNKIGLSKKDINIVLLNSNTEQASYSIGPGWYPGLRYGALSIKEF